jgi:predicted MFS family arabinose efflux permease
MSSRRLKIGYFALEGLNSFATVYYFYYFYFYMQMAHGFGNKANLVLAALNGAAYALGAWWGGKIAQRIGYFTALKIGFAVMMLALLAGSQITTASGQVVVMVVTVLGMCFTWPTLEALVSEGETRAGLQQMVGIYNVVWAGTGAVAYFTGGAMLDHLGIRSLFFFPFAILAIQLGLTIWLHREERISAGYTGPVAGAEEPHPHTEERTQLFLRMAWMANPFAYIAINTLIAVIPGIARQLELSTMIAGFVCSTWCFARLGAFVLLWKWDRWHYLFRWLAGAFAALVISFVLILVVPNLLVLVVAQLFFGLAVGVLYYSSLFYSMDRSETKSEHGGIHEAVIGVGNFAGPAVGAVSLHLFPQYANSGALSVSVLLLLGLGSMLAIWRSGPRQA